MKIIISLAFAVIFNSVIYASDLIEIETSIKDHKFYPDNLEVASGHKIRLTVKNLDNTIEEFDSIDLRREKIIAGNSSVHIILAPLNPGKYYFIGEFHPDTAKGCLTVID